MMEKNIAFISQQNIGKEWARLTSGGNSRSAGGTAETTTTLLLGKDFGLLNSFSRKSPFPKSEEIGLS